MAGDNGFGGPSSGGSYYGLPFWSDGIGLPSGRAMANGSTQAGITALFAYIGGQGGSRTASLSLGSAGTGVFGVASQASDSGSGWQGTNLWVVNGGTARFTVSPSGTMYFGKAGGGSVNTASSFTRAGTLGGAYRWIEAPAAPSMVSLTSSAGAATAVFSGSSDTGGSAITGWKLQYADNPAFTGATTVDSGGSSTVTPAPGKLYYFRAAGRNGLTDALGTFGPWSAALSVRVGVGGKRFDGTIEKAFTAAMRWDGVQEVPLSVAMRWDGTQEVAIS